MVAVATKSRPMRPRVSNATNDSLLMTSIVGARIERMNLRRRLTRTLVVGVLTMGVSYLVGKLVF